MELVRSILNQSYISDADAAFLMDNLELVDLVLKEDR